MSSGDNTEFCENLFDSEENCEVEIKAEPYYDGGHEEDPFNSLNFDENSYQNPGSIYSISDSQESQDNNWSNSNTINIKQEIEDEFQHEDSEKLELIAVKTEEEPPSVTSSRRRRFKCCKCKFTSYKKWNVKEHILRMHPRSRNEAKPVHKCENCDFNLFKTNRVVERKLRDKSVLKRLKSYQNCSDCLSFDMNKFSCGICRSSSDNEDTNCDLKEIDFVDCNSDLDNYSD